MPIHWNCIPPPLAPVNTDYAQRQFEVAKMYAMYWQAMATTGAAKLRKTQRGVEGGGWRDETDEEKTEDALNTMLSHIHRMNEINDFIEQARDGQRHSPDELFQQLLSRHVHDAQAACLWHSGLDRI